MRKEIEIADIVDFKWQINKFLEAAKQYPEATHFTIERYERNNYNHSLVLWKYIEEENNNG